MEVYRFPLDINFIKQWKNVCKPAKVFFVLKHKKMLSNFEENDFRKINKYL